MPRPREFDETVALEGAMNAFWAHGYEATSTQDLCTATGLGRSSVYNTFTSKHALFQRALEHYTERGARSRAEVLEQAEDGLDAIRRLLSDLIEDELGNGRRGCLMVNTIAEFGTADAEVTAKVETDTAAFLAALGDYARLGQADGSVTRDRDPADIAQFVHSTVGGLRLMSRRGAQRPAMAAVADIAVSALARR
ncbi:TetR/AcrR family transcriptional regulator [Amycolatopsis saalfeldensis]|uniref:DNA-binding transcriptional regulator, AcrR family n=1 Tax=Amycolatopsis saalfeldensis TaxID=394193 RepID=A0A1H8SL89_9PSEU|nr:TetR/AcrR family transcriptional regulator [Amycolatopsis saalfeldensis]SEO79452.1 DNA-binding transcriptional regulator, AcrR family [Amycolatopsis saalfeldensis]